MIVSTHSSRRGFSLVEVAIAIVIVAIVVISTVGLLAPVQQNIENVVSADEVSRLRRAVEIEMSVVRPNEEQHYKSAFDKAYESVKLGRWCYAFFYRAEVPDDISDLNGGRSRPYTGPIANERLGEDYVQQAAVFIGRYMSEMRADGFFDAAEGRVYVFRFRFLDSVMDDEAVASFNAESNSDNYSEAVLPVTVEFYTLESLELVANSGASSALGDFLANIRDGKVRPVFELNMAFNR